MSARPGFDTLATASARRASRRRGRRFGKSLFVLVVLGGLGAAGYVYGPELLERVREEQADQAPGSDEPAAPLEFPTQTAPPMEVRNATFVVDGLEADGATRRHEVTTDFETRVSRVLIDREDLPTLEVMTFLDSAVVRRIDRNVWYQTARGQFPLDDQLERDRWVRHLDELIPAMNRPAAAIEASTTAVLAGERMRHLVVTIDPRLLAGPSLHGGPPAGPPLEGVAPTDAARAAEPAPQAANPTDVAGAAPPIEGLPETETAPGAAAPVSIELWIDSRGLIRQLVIPDELGGDTLTVTAISPEAWIPDFPTEEQIEPLTASALVELGL